MSIWPAQEELDNEVIEKCRGTRSYLSPFQFFFTHRVYLNMQYIGGAAIVSHEPSPVKRRFQKIFRVAWLWCHSRMKRDQVDRRPMICRILPSPSRVVSNDYARGAGGLREPHSPDLGVDWAEFTSCKPL